MAKQSLYMILCPLSTVCLTLFLRQGFGTAHTSEYAKGEKQLKFVRKIEGSRQKTSTSMHLDAVATLFKFMDMANSV